MRKALGILVALSMLGAAALAPGTLAAQTSRSGLYENVRISEETGDEGGLRIRVNDGSPPTVDFTLCEGACLAMKRFPARIDGDRLTFVYVERNVDLAGRPASETRARIDGRFVREGLMVKIDFLDYAGDDNDPYVLVRRVKARG